ncbi:MAG: helix-turn-helix transcriptional regulator [Anaerolineales bacterium]|nr:helix-turn-helix transcriptional regulator [Anaerolineales bacterium]
MAKRSVHGQMEILDEHTSAHIAELFTAFGDTSRVRILSCLSMGEQNVGALAKSVGISESAVSHHMRQLRHLRLVSTRKAGREVYYRVDDPHILTLFWQGVNHIREEE